MIHEPRKKILILDDSSLYQECVRRLAEPNFAVDHAGSIQEAYWRYLEHPDKYRLVLLDFNLEANRSRSNFDGIDFASIVDVMAENRGLLPPWLVALTAASDDLVECFLNLSTRAPLLGSISKRMGASHVIDQLRVLFSALRDDDPAKFTAKLKRRKRFTPKIQLDEETLARLSNIFIEEGEKYFLKLAQSISKQLFSTYRAVEFSALAPGYSGSEVLSAIATRSADLTDGRTFVIKISKRSTSAAAKLDTEVRNYFNHGSAIKRHVPLLIGPFQVKGWQFIAYELILVEGRGIGTFADYLKRAINDKALTPERFEMDFSRRHSDFIFEKILRKWHESHEYSEPPSTRFLYHDWVGPLIKEAEQRFVAAYGDIKSQLRSPVLKFDLGLTPEALILANPLYVVEKLLTDVKYEYLLSAGLVHGDLHSGNILRSLTFFTGKPGEWMLIDFANVYPSAHLAQDGARLECDIKLNHFGGSLRPRFTLEVELAKWLDALTVRKLGDTLDFSYWSKEWKAAPASDKLVLTQILDIRKNIIKTVRDRAPSGPHSPYVDYAVSLLIQSLMFVRYSGNPIRTLHAWLAACLAATLISNYSELRSEQHEWKDMIGQPL